MSDIKYKISVCYGFYYTANPSVDYIKDRYFSTEVNRCLDKTPINPESLKEVVGNMLFKEGLTKNDYPYLAFEIDFDYFDITTEKI